MSRREEEQDIEEEQDHNHHDGTNGQRHKKIMIHGSIGTCIFILFLMISTVALTLWLVYLPTSPEFMVAGAAIYNTNMSSPSLLSTTMEFTIVARNPNKRASIYYDGLSAFVLYENQQITPQVILPPVFNEKKSTVAMSVVLGGAAMPVPVEVANGLVRGAQTEIRLRVVLLGRVKWKLGPIKIGYYAVSVKCDVMVGMKKGLVASVPLLDSIPCNVDL